MNEWVVCGGREEVTSWKRNLWSCFAAVHFASESTGRSGNGGCGNKSIHLYRGLDQWLQRRSLSAETEREEGGRPQLP